MKLTILAGVFVLVIGLLSAGPVAFAQGVGASAGTSTSLTTTVSRMVSRLRVMRRPSQMPKLAKRMATSAP